MRHWSEQCEVSWEVLLRGVVLREDSSPGHVLGAASFGTDFQRTNYIEIDIYLIEITKEVKVSWAVLPLASL